MSAPWEGPLRLQATDGYMPDIVDAEGYRVAEDVDPEDGAALVHRANAHDALVEALEKTKGDIEMAAARRSYNAGLGASEWESCLQTWEADALRGIDEALALASPEKAEAER